MFMVGEVDEPSPPQMPSGGTSDVAGAMTLVIGTLAALQARQQTGRGQIVDTSIFGSVITLLTFNTAFAVTYGYLPARRPRLKAGNPLCNSYKCGDGEWVELCMLQFDRYWSSFCQVMGLEHLEKDPRFSSLEKMVSNIKEVKARGAEVLLLCGKEAHVAEDVADHVLTLPDAPEWLMPSVTVVPLQLFAYYMAAERGCDIDQPRNLAKSVTVE